MYEVVYLLVQNIYHIVNMQAGLQAKFISI